MAEVDNFLNISRQTIAANKHKEDLTMLRIEHLTKTYGDKKAVDDLSLIHI